MHCENSEYYRRIVSKLYIIVLGNFPELCAVKEWLYHISIKEITPPPQKKGEIWKTACFMAFLDIGVKKNTRLGKDIERPEMEDFYNF